MLLWLMLLEVRGSWLGATVLLGLALRTILEVCESGAAKDVVGMLRNRLLYLDDYG